MSRRWRITLIVFVAFTLLVGGCAVTYHVKNSNIVKKATPIGLEYFKKEYNVDVEFTDSQVFAGYVSSKVVLYGHVKGDENEAINIWINYNTYEVENVGGPKGLIHPE
ncbi:hypothetical protein HNR77_000793 [Paenibacillus sp. JGP012]|uniref:hypothetical protein n=1 Tax=Paenibacillus sp. JGP012 TaxID=2735914 RepID=UPI00161D2D3C|nr:hypothetical protein [Paenibacillus sp. JGP012]MBB6019732.1 hypothetical protein [Paenibacillus sp. JGP012]